MSKHEFDDWIVKKYESEEIPYNPPNWELLSVKLNNPNNNKDKKAIVFWSYKFIGIAASVALLLVCSILLMSKKDTDPVIPQSSIAGNNKSAEVIDNEISAIKNEQTDSIAENDIEEKSVLKQSVITNRQNYHSGNTANKVMESNNTTQDNLIDKSLKETIITKDANSTHKQHDIDAQMRYLKETNNKTREEAETNSFVFKDPISSSYNYTDPLITSKASTSIGVGAGVNYGNMNTGYAVGVSAKKHLGSNIYVDGYVNVAMNNNTPNVVAVNNLNNIAARPSANQTHVNSPAMSNQSQQLYYVQFNPSIGYEFDDFVFLSVGSDIQQLVNGEKGKESVIFNDRSGNTELVPKVDLGLTAKTEFNITPNINAGIIYREGVNNLVNNNNVTGMNYLNRRYVQVMFKYNLNIR